VSSNEQLLERALELSFLQLLQSLLRLFVHLGFGPAAVPFEAFGAAGSFAGAASSGAAATAEDGHALYGGRAGLVAAATATGAGAGAATGAAATELQQQALQLQAQPESRPAAL